MPKKSNRISIGNNKSLVDFIRKCEMLNLSNKFCEELKNKDLMSEAVKCIAYVTLTDKSMLDCARVSMDCIKNYDLERCYMEKEMLQNAEFILSYNTSLY